MKILKKLSITALAALATFVAVAQTPQIIANLRVNGFSDLRGDIENQTGTVTIDDNAAVTGSLTVTGALIADSIAADGAALTDVDDANVTLSLGGSPTTALLNATSLTMGWNGQLSVPRGGTGAATLTGLLQGNGTSAFTAITNSSTVGQVLSVTGASTYTWGSVILNDSDAVTGILPVANGGLNLSAALDDNLPVGNGTTWQSKALTDCDDTAGNHLNYDTATNVFSCGTSGGGGGSPGGLDTQLQFNDMSSFGGIDRLKWVGGELEFGDVGGLGLQWIGVTGTGASAGSEWNLIAGKGGSSGDGGQVSITGGESGSTGNGGLVSLNGGPAFSVGTGGAVGLNGGLGGGTSGDGGPVQISGGNAQVAGDGGDVSVTVGAGAGGGVAGQILFNSINVTPTTGTFTITFDTACTTSPTQVVRYNTIGNIVMLTTNASGDAFNCTSDSTGFADSGTPVPAAIRPSTSVNLPLVSALDNTAAVYASILISSSGGVQVELCSSYGGAGNPCANPAWTNSGTKGLNNWSGSYNINN